jgi:UDP-2,3-diacylglucosamine pyrophosphatase LpxH
LKKLMEKLIVWVTGNHDDEMLERESYLGVPIVKTIIIDGVLYMHGHEFDATRSAGNSVGRYVTEAVGWIERNVYARADILMRQAEQWVRKLGKFGTPEAYREKALDFVEQFAIDEGFVSGICLGHTHVQDFASRKLGKDRRVVSYWNCGTWIQGQTGGVVMTKAEMVAENRDDAGG